MIRHLIFWIVFVPNWAFGYDSVTFMTGHDTFTVNKTAQRITVDGKTVSGNLLSRLEPLLTGPLADACPKLSGRASITATVVTGGQSEKREFFVQQNVVRSGSKCSYVSGEGMFYLPLHRSWLIGPFNDGLKLNSPLKVESGNSVMASLVKKDGEWTDSKEPSVLDWDFFGRFEQSLLNYRITYRLLPEAGTGKPVVTVTSGSQKIKFVRVQPKTWAIERPGRRWLEVSSDWGFWFDLDSSIWRDRHADDIEKAEAPGLAADARLGLMKKLDEAAWTRALESFYHRRLIDKREDLQVRIQALERLKNKPSWRNIRAEMTALENDPPDELLNLLTLSLRARNSRGPTFETGTNRNAVIRKWSEWWKDNSSRKD